MVNCVITKCMGHCIIINISSCHHINIEFSKPNLGFIGTCILFMTLIM
jgi:hypothetical protein